MLRPYVTRKILFLKLWKGKAMTTYINCYSDSARGIYIPQHFAESIIRECLSGVTNDDLAILESGPDTDLYWEVWDDVLSDAELTDSQGNTWTLWQDGDLWLIRTDTPHDQLTEFMGDF